MFTEEGVDVFKVDALCALSLGENEVEKDGEADPRVEWDPT